VKEARLRKTVSVNAGNLGIGGKNPVRVQSMADTDTADVRSTASQLFSLWQAGSELLRITVNSPEAAEAVPKIKNELLKRGCCAPLIGDFHYNGHILLKNFPKAAHALDKFRINPGNTGKGDARRDHFLEICRIAKELKKAIRIGVNSGSLDEELLSKLEKRNSKRKIKLAPNFVILEAMIESALTSLNMALDFGLKKNQIVLSCKTTEPNDLIYLYRKLAKKTDQPLHLGLTEAGGGIKGIVWSSIAAGILLSEGIGETVRVSLTPAPGGDRRDEVYAAKEILESLDLRHFSPKIISCPGCGRTSSDLYRRLAFKIDAFIKERSPKWQKERIGVEKLKIAVMGCIVNGPGESKMADIGISLPGRNENPRSMIYVKGKEIAAVKGDLETLAREMFSRIESFIEKECPLKGAG
jgi:(E)-4-hydroxy-3-methylbut-2-enyl-diphosphate synthase